MTHLVDVRCAHSAVQVPAVRTLLAELGQQRVLHELDEPRPLAEAGVHLLGLLHLDLGLGHEAGGVLHEPERHVEDHAGHLVHRVLPPGGHAQHALAPAEV